MTASALPILARRRLLLVEDDYFLIQELIRVFEAGGAEIAGAVSSVEDALAVIARPERLDGAILDINLLGEMVFPVADALIARGIPFVFATGYGARSIPLRFRHVARYEKPVEPAIAAAALFAG